MDARVKFERNSYIKVFSLVPFSGDEYRLESDLVYETIQEPLEDEIHSYYIYISIVDIGENKELYQYKVPNSPYEFYDCQWF